MSVKTKTVLNRVELSAVTGMTRMKIDYALRIKKLQFDMVDGHGRALFQSSRVGEISKLLAR